MVDVVTRAGSRNFHGSAAEFFRNEGLDAHNFFEDPKLPRPVGRRHLFAGSLGGPLPLPRSFFFVAYEGLRSTAKASVGLVPDAALRSGNFRGRAPIFDPLDLDPATGQPLQSSQLGRSRSVPGLQTVLRKDPDHGRTSKDSTRAPL